MCERTPRILTTLGVVVCYVQQDNDNNYLRLRMYAIRTQNDNTTVVASSYNIGSDGFVHAKNETDVTVASVPVGNLEGVFLE